MHNYFSQYYGISSIEEESWFDPLMSRDTLLFIDPFLVFETDIPLFINAQETFFNFFNAAFELAHEAIHSQRARDKLETVLKFPEPKELCLGFSKVGTSGSGSGGGYSRGFADALIKLASAGHNGIKHFEEVEIFTSGIGKDRISDATANLIKPELIKYTQEVCEKFNVPTISHAVENAGFKYRFKRWEDRIFSLPSNPFFSKGERGVILVPKQFLQINHAIGSDGFEDYIKDTKNKELRIDLNYEIEKELSKFKKSVTVDLAERHPQWIREYVDYIENEAEIKPYDLEFDKNNLYRNDRKVSDFIISNPLHLSASDEEGFTQFLDDLIFQFKRFIEELDGYKLLWDFDKNSPSNQYQPRNESTARSLFSSMLLGYCQLSEVLVEKSSELGSEIVEFTFPSGYKNIAFLEFKLARNSRLHKDEDELKKFLAHVRSKRVNHRYYIVVPYTKKEFELMNKSIDIINLMDVGDLQFKFIIVNSFFNLSDETKQLDTKILKTLEKPTSMRTILFISANPTDTSRLRLDEECKKIEEGLVRAKYRDQFRIVSKWAVTDDDLRRALLYYEPEIVHFSGHSGVNGIGLENNMGECKEVSGESLAQLFELCPSHVKCLVLNACYSEIQANAISDHIDYVIGMKEKIGDRAAIKFSEGFYDALGAGKTFAIAYKFGCNAIDLHGIPENLTPVFKSNPNLNL